MSSGKKQPTTARFGRRMLLQSYAGVNILNVTQMRKVECHLSGLHVLRTFRVEDGSSLPQT